MTQETGSAPSAQARIVLEGAAKVFAARSGATVAFQGVNLSVHEGELLCVLGPERVRQIDAPQRHSGAGPPLARQRDRGRTAG